MRIILAAAVAAFGLSATPVLAQDVEPLLKEMEQAARDRAQGAHCAWLAAQPQAALKADSDEVLAQIQAFAPASLATAQARLQAAEQKGAGESCQESAANILNGRWSAIAAHAGDREFLLWVRAAFFLQAEAQAAYAYDLTTLKPYRAVINQEAAAAAANAKPQRLAEIEAIARSQVPAALGQVCALRKTVRWPKGERPCPALPAQAANQSVFAQRIVETTEAFVAAGGPPPTAGKAFFTAKASPMATGGSTCRIEKTIGTASASGYIGPDGLTNTFQVTVGLAPPTLRGVTKQGLKPDMLMFDLDGRARAGWPLRLRSLQLSLPTYRPDTHFDQVSFVLGGKSLALENKVSFFGTLQQITPNDINKVDGLAEAFLPAVAKQPVLKARLGSSTSAGADVELEQTIPDLATLLNGIDGAALQRAYADCWP